MGIRLPPMDFIGIGGEAGGEKEDSRSESVEIRPKYLMFIYEYVRKDK